MELRPGVGELVKQAQVQMRLAKEARRVRVVAAVRGNRRSLHFATPEFIA
jgi:hypothetical protein